MFLLSLNLLRLTVPEKNVTRIQSFEKAEKEKLRSKMNSSSSPILAYTIDQFIVYDCVYKVSTL